MVQFFLVSVRLDFIVLGGINFCRISFHFPIPSNYNVLWFQTSLKVISFQILRFEFPNSRGIVFSWFLSSRSDNYDLRKPYNVCILWDSYNWTSEKLVFQEMRVIGLGYCFFKTSFWLIWFNLWRTVPFERNWKFVKKFENSWEFL